jgi:hypothetical protein
MSAAANRKSFHLTLMQQHIVVGQVGLHYNEARPISIQRLIQACQTLRKEAHLTCTACETKLKRALDSIASVRNTQTSLLLSQAEFDLDTSISTVNEAIRSIERTTGFTCQRVSPKGQNLDLLVNGDAREFINNDYPAGASNMSVTVDNIVRITATQSS